MLSDGTKKKKKKLFAQISSHCLWDPIRWDPNTESQCSISIPFISDFVVPLRYVKFFNSNQSISIAMFSNRNLETIYRFWNQIISLEFCTVSIVNPFWLIAINCYSNRLHLEHLIVLSIKFLVQFFFKFFSIRDSGKFLTFHNARHSRCFRL